jgi:hypothetical protein
MGGQQLLSWSLLGSVLVLGSSSFSSWSHSSSPFMAATNHSLYSKMAFMLLAIVQGKGTVDLLILPV